MGVSAGKVRRVMNALGKAIQSGDRDAGHAVFVVTIVFALLGEGFAQTDPQASAVSGGAGSGYQTIETPSTEFDWKAAASQSFCFLSIEHSFRLTQGKTRQELGGPFFPDWYRSVQGVQGWNDGDSAFTNYLAHPMQGGVAGFIYIQNDPSGKALEFEGSRRYWHSRLRAFGWAALYSTQFELGPYGEAAIGNVGKKKYTGGFVDLVVTPIGGLGMIVLEDWLDKYWVQSLEARTSSKGKRILYRILLNPQRSFANLLRKKYPWHRDARSLSN